MNTNPTQLAGLSAFALSAFACMWAARLQASPWRGLAGAQLACLAEVLMGWRLRVHDAVDSLLQGEGWYAMREAAQVPLLGLTTAFGLAWAVFAIWHWGRRDRNACIASLATSWVVLLFVVESISLHRVDALMYAPAGPFLTVGLGWCAGAAFVVLAALRSILFRQVRPQS